jgi:TPR repeat protein
LAAHQRGDYTTALKFFRPLAEQGAAKAQHNPAAMQGSEKAQENRDIVASKMTPDQITKAQRMAREWTAKHQQ